MAKLIYNQTEIPREQWRYGLRSSARVGCGWVAVYNALCLLGREVEVEPLIRSFERQLPLINGNVGTFAAGPALLLRARGFRVEMTARMSCFDEKAADCPVGILFYYWRSGWRVGAHFAAVQYQNGRYIGYNTFTNSHGPDDYGPSLRAFLKSRGYFGCVLTCIREPEGEDRH